MKRHAPRLERGTSINLLSERSSFWPRLSLESDLLSVRPFSAVGFFYGETVILEFRS